MSHLFGCIRTSADGGNFRVPGNVGKLLVDTPIFQLYSSGITETTFCSNKKESGNGFVVVGVGLRKENEVVKHLNKNDWKKIVSNPVFDTSALNGHYLAVKWNDEKVELKNDFLGLRTAYLYTSEDRLTYFSTRLDWLSRVIPKPEIDLSNFGAYWVLINQIDNECFLKQVKRLGPSACVVCENGDVKIEEKLFKPSFRLASKEDFSTELKAYSNPTSDFNLTLGLSGGLDSRTILSAFSKSSRTETYSFGDRVNPDVFIAKRVAHESGVPHLFYEERIPLFRDSESEIMSYIGQLQGVSSVHGFYRKKVFEDINSQEKLMIDGGFGEIHRRQFLGRLAFLNSKKPSEINTEELFHALTDLKFNFFNRYAFDEMIEGSKSQITNVWKQAISNSDSTLGNSIDLFSLYSRVSNTSAMDHSWSDSLLPAYMPFVQKSLLEIMFKLPVKKRTNGRLFREFIIENHRALKNLPLVKSGLTYPFSFGKYTALGFTKLKMKFVKPFHDSFGKSFLLKNKDYVMDVMNSKSVQEYELYEYDEIKKTIEGFYSGNYDSEVSVNQWLSFELWRKTAGF